MKAVTRSLIESIAAMDVSEFAQQTEDKVSALVSMAVQDMSKSLPFISVEKCILQPANETFNGAMTPESEFIYFLGLDSPQLEINCIQYNDSWKKFKERLRFAWTNSKKKKRKKKKNAVAEAPFIYQEGKYNLSSLTDDLQVACVRHLMQTSIVYNQEKRLRIIGRDDFGAKTQIFIYPCLMQGDNFKFLISRKKGFFTINFTNRAKLIQEKAGKVGDNFAAMLKILNTLFRSVSSESPNQIFLESLLYNTPDELFEGDDIYDVFLKIVNYLNLTDTSEFCCILNPEMKISEDITTKYARTSFAKFLGSLDAIDVDKSYQN